LAVGIVIFVSFRECSVIISTGESKHVSSVTVDCIMWSIIVLVIIIVSSSEDCQYAVHHTHTHVQ